MDSLTVVAFVVVGLSSYLIGSIPAGYIVGRFAGIDIRGVGSGNIGATNVLRALGKPYGYSVFFFDFFKGVAAVRLSIFLINAFRPGYHEDELVGIFAGVVCVLGHTYPIWLGFKGGKGVATSAGVLFGLMPLAALIVLAVWFVAFQTTKYVSVASIVAAVALPIVAALMVRFERAGTPLVYLSACLAVVIVWRHRSNVSRLMKGTEPSFRQK
jgi:acyl phosphate:glycerol-3-phosphate acyltransferase